MFFVSVSVSVCVTEMSGGVEYLEYLAVAVKLAVNWLCRQILNFLIYFSVLDLLNFYEVLWF